MFLKPKELEKYLNTTNEGTYENPKIYRLDWEYKLALFLGFNVKWDFDYRMEYEYKPYVEKQVYYLRPVLKFSHEKFDSFWCDGWSNIMESILPKMRQDNLITNELQNIKDYNTIIIDEGQFFNDLKENITEDQFYEKKIILNIDSIVINII